MHKLVRISFHNWFLLESGRDIEVKDSIALLGQTGVGKSCIIDGIQVVQTGNHGRARNLNASAGAVHDRTVADYCLGKMGSHAARPDGSETILALTYRDEDGHEVAFGLLLTVYPDQLEKEETRSRFVIKGNGFSLADFTRTTADGREFIPGHDMLVAQMKERYGKAISFHQTGTHFVEEFTSAMRPKDPPDPQRYLKAFAVSLSAKEINDPTDFVRRLVLQDHVLDITGVRESIKIWKELKAKVKQLEDKLAAARGIHSRYVSWTTKRVEFETASYLRDFADKMLVEARIKEAGRAMAGFNEQRIRKAAEIEELKAAIERCREANESDRLRRLQSEEAQKVLLLQAQFETARAEMNAAGSSLIRMVGGYVQVRALEAAAAVLPAYAREAAGLAAELGRKTAGNPGSWAGDGTEIRLVAEAIRSAARVKDSLHNQYEALTEQRNTLKAEKDDLEELIRNAGSGGAMLTRETQTFRSELMRMGIRTIALPDVVEVKEEHWAFALEALLGNGREALIVPRDQAEEALQYLRRNKNRFDGCRVIDTRKTADYPPRMTTGSIAEMAVTDDPDALAFIWQVVGNVQRVSAPHELAKVRNGITTDGLRTSGVMARVYRDRPPILGKTAQAAALEEAREKLEASKRALAMAEAKRRLVEGALDIARQIERLDSPELIEKQALTFENARLLAARITQDINDVGEEDPDGILQAIADRNERITDMRGEISEAEKVLSTADRSIGNLEQEIETLRSKVDQLLDSCSKRDAEQNDAVTQRLIVLSGIEETIHLARARVVNQLGIAWQGREKAELERIRSEAMARTTQQYSDEVGKVLTRADRALTDFFPAFQMNNPLPDDATAADRFFWVNVYVDRLERNELIPHRQRVDEAKEEVEKMLKEDLLAKLFYLLEEGRRDLDTLNRRLARHRFLGQTYQFVRKTNDRFKPFVDLARKVATTQQLDLGALREDADPDMRGALARIEEIVSTEVDTREIADYRNYADYDLAITNAEGETSYLSTAVGKLSGGQRQAPYYIAIAASMIATYRPNRSRMRGEDKQGMGLVVFDEAFNKIDVVTTQRLIRFFDDLGLQIVVAAPEDKRATFLEAVDTILNVAREDSSLDLFIDVHHPGRAAKQAMREANPAHIGVDGYRGRMVARDGVAAPPRTSMNDDQSKADDAEEPRQRTGTDGE